MSESYQIHVMDRRAILRTRNFVHKTASSLFITHSNVFWKVFRIFCWNTGTSLFVMKHWSKVDSLKLTQHWVKFGTPIRHSSHRVSPYWKTNDLKSAEQVLRINPMLLRKRWTDWRKGVCETTTLLSSNLRCSDLIIFILLCFSQILGPTHLFLEI